MTIKPSLIILDIGSHKLEELQSLLSPFPRQWSIYIFWVIKRVIKAILRRDEKIWSNFRKQLDVIKYYFLKRRRYNLKIVSIEPNPTVVLPHIRRLSKIYKVLYVPAAVLGHDAEASSDLKVLYDYGRSISSSLYRKDSVLDPQPLDICVGLKFGVIWKALVREGFALPDSEVILRMNCEGAELGVLKECQDLGLRLKCIIGSIGDIEKIHGAEIGQAGEKLIQSLGIEYHYFKGDDPSTWYDAAAAWEANTVKYRVSA